jgi:hypothetical protein
MAFDGDQEAPTDGTLTLFMELPDAATREAYLLDTVATGLSVLRGAVASDDPAALRAQVREGEEPPWAHKIGQLTRLHGDLRAQLAALEARLADLGAARDRGDAGAADRLFREVLVARWNGVAMVAAIREILGQTGDSLAQLTETMVDTPAGRARLRLIAQTGHAHAIRAVGFDAAGRQVISVDEGGRIIVRDAATGLELGDPVPGDPIPAAAPLDPSLTSLPGVLAVLADRVADVCAVARSPSADRPLVVVGLTSGELRAIDPGQRRAAWSIPPMRLAPRQITIAEGNRSFTVTAEDDTVYTWDATSGRLADARSEPLATPTAPAGEPVTVTRIFAGHVLHRAGVAVGYHELPPGYELTAAAFSASGRRVLLLHDDGSTFVLEVPAAPTPWLLELSTTRRAGAARLRARYRDTTAAALSPDGRLALIGTGDGVLHGRDVDGAAWLFHALAYPDGRWAVADDEARFDASSGGEAAGLHWVLGDEPIALTQLKDRYYDPFLLAKKLGHNPEEPRVVQPFAPALPPAVTLAEEADGPSVRVGLSDRGGGFGAARIAINGKERFVCTVEEDGGDVRVRVDGKGWWPAQAQRDAAGALVGVSFSVPVGARALVREGTNRMDVIVDERAGLVRSRATSASWVVRPVEIGPDYQIDPRPPAPHLWAIVAGISRYAGASLQLRYAAKDAEDFAAALRVAGPSLFGADHVHVTVLSSERGPEAQPTRPNLEAAFTRAAAARSGDVLVVYLAGHGARVAAGTDDEDFVYLTQDAESGDLSDPAVRRRVAVSGDELIAWLERVPALKQVFVLDTCHAGQLVAGLEGTRDLLEKVDVPSSQVRAIERMKDRAGLFVLAGAAADAVSYEATRYAQGLLTYALLFGMRGAALREAKYVDVAQLFNLAVDKVPDLAEGIGGVQRPLLAIPAGARSFDIGELSAEARALVPLGVALPMVVKASFQDEDEFVDGARLGPAVDEALRLLSVGAPKLVFVEADDFPGAHRLVGRYRRHDGQIAVNARLVPPGGAAVALAAEGLESALGELAARLVALAAERMKPPAGPG